MISALKTSLKILLAIVICTSLIIILASFSSPNKTNRLSKSISDSLITVPLGGNAWRVDKDTLGGKINNDGIVNWSSAQASFTCYVRLGQTGSFRLYLYGSVPNGESKIAVTALGVTKEIFISRNSVSDHLVGEWRVTDTGYVAFKIKGLSKIGPVFANINSIKLEGTAIGNKASYVKNNDGDFFYWGRRGPSVHLGYVVPDEISAEWFYNEVTVPKGNDVLHSYFMANGFNEGYFGMQVNSLTERHILFSAWSPFTTDDPKSIPADQKIIMLKKGENVHTGEFGDEGSGGQSYLNYNWQAGTTYKFLVHAKPSGQNHTEYTAYFYAPELNKWLLIASFSRPNTNTYLKHLHSFLENFEPDQGTITRKVLFNNQWIYDTAGKWTELTKARFTGDNTAVKGYRMDYAGGLSDGSFYLQNCGFFNKYTPRNTFFERQSGGKKPDIDLNKLP